MSDLAIPFEMALPSFVKHIGALETSGLIASRKTGRARTWKLEPQKLTAIEEWFGEQPTVWESRGQNLDTLLARMNGEDDESRSETGRLHCRWPPIQLHRRQGSVLGLFFGDFGWGHLGCETRNRRWTRAHLCGRAYRAHRGRPKSDQHEVFRESNHALSLVRASLDHCKNDPVPTTSLIEAARISDGLPKLENR